MVYGTCNHLLSPRRRSAELLSSVDFVRLVDDQRNANSTSHFTHWLVTVPQSTKDLHRCVLVSGSLLCILQIRHSLVRISDICIYAQPQPQPHNAPI